jgi:hypothetical protein
MPRRIRPATAARTQTRGQPDGPRRSAESFASRHPAVASAATAGASLLLLDSAIGLEQPGAASADAQVLLEVLEALAQPR